MQLEECKQCFVYFIASHIFIALSKKVKLYNITSKRDNFRNSNFLRVITLQEAIVKSNTAIAILEKFTICYNHIA